MLLSQLLLTSATLLLGVTAHAVTHTHTHTHLQTITVHQSSLATARPFGEHSSKHFEHHHRVGSKNAKSRSSKKVHHHKKSKKRSGKKSTCAKGEPVKTGVALDKTSGSKKIHHSGSTAKHEKHHGKSSSTTKHDGKPASNHSKPQSKPEAKHKKEKKKESEPKGHHEKTSSAQTSPAASSKTSPPQLIASSAPSSSSPGLSKLAQDSLKAHNDLRAKYKVGPLSWNTELAAAAQDWTNKCIYQHGKGKEIGAGENIAAYTGADNVDGAISMWSNEASLYSFAAPGYADATGHFTQQVWKATTEIGCAQTLCPTLTFPGKPSWSNGYFYVCEYKTGGNIVGSTSELTAKYFSENVLH